MGWIYLIRNNVNGKCYVGQTRQKKLEQRWSQHKCNPRRLLKFAFEKYGFENFEFSIICEIHNDDLDAREILEIKERNSLVPNGYNLASGGNSNVITHPETRKKMSESAKGKNRPQVSEANKLRIYTDETRRKRSEAARGRVATEETKVKLKEACRLRSDNEDYKRKLSEALKGRKISEEAKAKMSKSVEQWSKDGKTLMGVHGSITSIANKLGIDVSGISKCCRGKKPTAGGFFWKFNSK